MSMLEFRTLKNFPGTSQLGIAVPGPHHSGASSRHSRFSKAPNPLRSDIKTTVYWLGQKRAVAIPSRDSYRMHWNLRACQLFFFFLQFHNDSYNQSDNDLNYSGGASRQASTRPQAPIPLSPFGPRGRFPSSGNTVPHPVFHFWPPRNPPRNPPTQGANGL